MAALVIDSSIAASWCFPDERTDYTNAILRAVSTPLEAIAPRLWAYEVRNLALRESLPLASLDNALCKAARNSSVVLFQP